MGTESCHEQNGVIESIEQGLILVNVQTLSACASCHAKGACTTLDVQNNQIEVRDYSGDYKVGDKVMVRIRKNAGYLALFLGYVAPFIVMFTTLIVLTESGKSELTSGIISLGLLIPYYLILFFTREKLSKRFTFEITKN